ncbi:hypothetical protein [Thalassovita aquimarina]|uniref:N-ATPase, AtpR subunit n=1 Tax=Thalassovita aquimarina TaxID=2785917 RepID=A0ABS5HNW5_9RHOB|nr:hypothetical protein [Thalassovita aquimarina]MBR9650609.1 hypothetical protein [Thalassovita aquimarina]
MTLATGGELIFGVFAGMALAALHLMLLRRAAERLGKGGGVGALLGGAVLRLGLVLAGFAAVAWLAPQPGFALVAGLCGFALARTLILRRVQRTRR